MYIAVVVTLRLRVAKVNEGGLEGHYKPQETTGARAVGPLRRCGRHGKNSRMMTRDAATVGGEMPSTPVRQPAAGLQKRTDSRSVASHPNSAANFTTEISRPSAIVVAGDTETACGRIKRGRALRPLQTSRNHRGEGGWATAPLWETRQEQQNDDEGHCDCRWRKYHQLQ